MSSITAFIRQNLPFTLGLLTAGIVLMFYQTVLVQAGGIIPFLRRSDPGEKFQIWLDEGRELRKRRLTEQAIASFNRILEVDAVNDEATYEVAETFFQARQWLEAMDWFYIVSLFDPQRREAYTKRWIAIFKLAEGDTILKKTARQTVKQEITDFLKDYPWDWETLNTAREGAVLIDDSLLADELTRRILTVSPDTPAGYDILSNRFYEGLYPIWDDDSAKVAYLRYFLDNHPVSQFRETAWLYLIHSLNRTEDLNALRTACNEWMAEDPDNPLPFERAVDILMENGVSPDSLLPLARKAVDNCRGWRGKPLKHVEQRIMEGKKLYAATRLNVARLLIQLSRNEEARLWLRDGLKNSGFGVDDEGTGAAFHYYLGKIAEMGFQHVKPPIYDYQTESGSPSGPKYAMLRNFHQEAFDHYVDALIEGDTRGKWTQKADSAAQRLFTQILADSASDLIGLARTRKSYAGPRFEDATDLLGLTYIKASRVAWGDANGDSYDDLLLGGKRLFLNIKGSKFTEVTEPSGLKGRGIRGGVWADVDLDGDLDLFCAGNGGDDGGDRLFLNEGNNRDGVPQFRDVTDQIGNVRDGHPTEGAAWGDLQGDGRPDLYVANYEASESDMSRGTPDFLYMNLLDPQSPLGFRFQKLGPGDGLQPPFGENLCGRGVNWGDFDGDADQDFYVSNYRLQENLLWVNAAGDIVENKAAFYRVAGLEKEGWWGHTIGSEWGDFDNDGDLDLFTANLAHPRYIEFSNRSCLYENRLKKDGLFQDVRAEWGIKYEETHSDPAWGDLDGDGDLDLYLTSIYPNRRSFLYENDLDHNVFRDVTFLAGVRVTNAWGCAFSDFDNDGDLDLAVGSNEGVRLFRNLGTNRHWLGVDVRTPGSGYGTKILLRRGKERQWRELSGGKGTTSQHSRVAYFGLGDDDAPVKLEILYPSGRKTKLKKIAPDQILVVEEP